MRMIDMDFYYNAKTGCVYSEKSKIVYFEKNNGIYPYIKNRGKKYYLAQKEVRDLFRLLAWCRDKLDSDFGHDVNTAIELNRGWCLREDENSCN
jgi:hypothetical protein